MGFKLCGDYVEFLKEIGWLEFSGDTYLGLWAGKGRRNEASDFVSATIEFNEKVGKQECLTVFHNDSWEFLLLIDHRSSTIVTYDPFAKEFEDLKVSILDFIENDVRDQIKANEKFKNGTEWLV